MTRAKAKDIWEVEFDGCCDGSKDGTREDPLWVLASGAEDAIARLRKARVGTTFKWEDEGGKTKTSKVTAIHIIAVECVGSIDVGL